MRTILAGLAALLLSSTALAGDPFDDARYFIQTRSPAEALALVDGGKVDVNAQTNEGYTLLHYAAEAGHLEMVKALLARGANPTVNSSRGSTPYDFAVGSAVQAELRKAASAWSAGAPRGPGAVDLPAVSARVSDGMCARAINDPASRSRAAALRPFLAAKDAIWYNHPDQLAGLLEDCVKPTDVDEYGWTLLHHAADRDRVELARILMAHGARSGALNKDRQTAAHLATSPEMKALLGAPPAPVKLPAEEARKVECEQKYRADAALASDTTGRMSAMRRWQQCLDTGRYW